jgi:hypothetical protein
MKTTRIIAVILGLSLALSGCGTGLSKVTKEAGFVLVPRNTSWLGFLPINQILGEAETDPAKAEAEARSLQARLVQLRRRARALRASTS